MNLGVALIFAAAATVYVGPARAQDGDDSVAPEFPDAPGPTAEAAAPDVGSSGAYTRSISLDLPPGRRGVAPSIALDYASAGGVGVFGLGWSLRGLPAIVRVNAGDGVTFTSRDTYALVGSWLDKPSARARLVPIGGGHYHLAQDSRQRFTRVGTCATNQPCSWMMRDGSGRTYYFGAESGRTTPGGQSTTIPSRVVGGTTDAIAAWGLSRVVDDHNNAYEVTYADQPGHLYPYRIQWTLPVASNPSVSIHELVFDYEHAPDAPTAPAIARARVSRIRLLTATREVRRWDLSYRPSVASGRSLLRAIQLVGEDVLAAPPIEFAYSGDVAVPHPFGDMVSARGFASGAEVRSGYAPDLTNLRWTSLVGDVNADGRDDVIRLFAATLNAGLGTTQCGAPFVPGRAHQQTTLQLSLGQPTGSAEILSEPVLLQMPNYICVPEKQENYSAELADINGDGHADVVQYAYNSVGIRFQYWMGERDGVAALEEGPSASWAPTNPETPIIPNTLRLTRGDFNGDQRPDFALLFLKYGGTGGRRILSFHGDPEAKLGPAVETPWSYRPAITGEQFRDMKVGDVNGDGYEDVVVLYSTAVQLTSSRLVRVAVGWGSAAGLSEITEEVYTPAADIDTTWPTGTGNPAQELVLGDFDGDGAQEIFLAATGMRTGAAKYWATIRGRQPSAPGTLVSLVHVIDATPRYGYSDPGRPAAPDTARYNHVAPDTDGDGRADLLALYMGARGADRQWAYVAGVNGVWAQPSHEMAVRASDSDVRTDGPQWSDQWHFALGDANGDGLVDVFPWHWHESDATRTWFGLLGKLGHADRDARVLDMEWMDTHDDCGRSPTYCTSAQGLPIRGTNLGSGPKRRDRSIGLYNKDSVHVEVGDLNGDGRSDLIWLDDSVLDTKDDRGFPIYVWPSLPGTSPDLLTAVRNGQGGTVSIEYVSTADMRGAIQGKGLVELPSCGGGVLGVPAGASVAHALAICGAAQTSPSYVVSRIAHDNGRSARRSWVFGYENGRVRLGGPTERESLGFQFVHRRDVEAEFETTTEYNQVPDVVGQPTKIVERDNRTARVRKSHEFTYDRFSFFPDTTFIERDESILSEYDDAGLLERIIRKHVVSRDSFGYPTVTESCVTGDARVECSQVATTFLTHDFGNYWLARPSLVWTYSSFDQHGIDLHRYTYWPSYASDLASHERLLVEDVDLFDCAATVEASGLCSDLVQQGDARWVPVARYRQLVGGVAVPGYDVYGQTTHVEDARGAVTVTSYDAVFRTLVASKTNALGHVVENNRYDWAGRLEYTDDANNQRTSYTYDGLGRLKNVLRPLAGVSAASPSESWEYLDVGLPSQRTKVTRRVSATDSAWAMDWIDGFGLVYATETSSTGAASVLEQTIRQVGNAGVSTWMYRPVHRPVGGVAPEPEGLVTERYDNHSRLEYTSVTGFVSGSAVDVGTVNVISTRLASAYKDAAGRTTVKAFNAHRQLVSVTDTGGGVLRYGYDVAGNMRSVSRPALGTTSSTYDSFGRITSRDEPETGTTQYYYDDIGQIVETRRANGHRETSTYDLLGRAETTLRDGAQLTRWTYDAVPGRTVPNARGRLVEISYPLGTTAQLGRYRVLEYDSLGRVVHEDRTVHTTTGAHRYGYDDLGRVTEKTFPDLTRQTNEYYASGGPIRRMQAVRGLTVTTLAEFLDYTASGQVKLKRAGGVTTTYLYDAWQRLDTLTARGVNGNLVQAYRYSYDGLGNVTAINDLRGAQTVVGGVDTTESQSFAYDELYRLDSATTAAEGTRTFDYDAGGNIILKDGVARSYGLCAVGSFDRCIVGTVAGAEQWRARHDAAGDRAALELKAAGLRWDYEYDSTARLLWARRRGYSAGNTGPVQTSAAFAYGAKGERVRKVYTNTAAATTTTIWLGGDYELRTTSRGAGTSQTKHYHTPDGRRIASLTDGSILPGQQLVSALPAMATGVWRATTTESVPAGWVFLHSNHLGSSSVTTDEAGRALSRTLYAPFGEVVAARSRGTNATTTKFGGLELDEETGLHFAAARYYDTLTARFITADTIVPGLAQSSQGWNRFAYTENNPVKYVDPSGHLPEPAQTILPVLDTKNMQISDWSNMGEKAIDTAFGFANGLWGGGNGPVYGNDRSYGAGQMLGAAVGAFVVDPAIGTAGAGMMGLGGGASSTGVGAAVGAPALVFGGAVTAAAAGAFTFHGAKLVQGLAAATGGSNNAQAKSGPYRGGRHADTKQPIGDGLESHHMPSKSSSSLDPDEGPAIQMEAADHRLTASWGSSKSAQEYRAKQRSLLEAGRRDEAIQMDIDDIQSKFGSKYDEAILEMLDSL
jgi:RHS repeat-associated protein